MGAYIINVPDTVDTIIYVNIGDVYDGKTYIASQRVEDLTPYTEPDLEQVRKEAYEEGRKVGIKDGMCEAWEVARKVVGLETVNRRKVFGTEYMYSILKNNTATEAIEKIRQYEQEKRFCVGDEFENESGKRFVILKMDGTEIDRYIDEEGKTYCMIAKYKVMRKTGRHFSEIAAVLEKMRGEQDG